MFAELLLLRSRQTWLTVELRAAEWGCTLQDASRAAAAGTRAAPYLLTGSCAAEPCSCMHVCHSCAVQSDTLITTAREGWGRESGTIIGDGVGEQCVQWLNNICGILGFVWSQDWNPLLWWCWGEREVCRDFTDATSPGLKSEIEV